MRTQIRQSLMALAAALLLMSGALVQAANTGFVSFDGGDPTPADCNNVNLVYDYGWIGDTDDDGLGNDHVAFIMADADGNILDNDFLFGGFGMISSTDSTTFGAIESIAARPVTIALFDISDSTLYDQHSPAGVALTLSGTLLDQDVFDPGMLTTNSTCELLPLKEPFSFESGAGSDGAQFFEPGDDRINRQAYAYAAIYCDADLQGVNIYGINSTGAGTVNNGRGFEAIFVPYAELPPTPSAEDGNLLIEQFENIRFYRLTSGEYQVNVGPDPEGKQYILVWDGCPQTYIRASILWNGVLTPTEIFPRG